jgi:hypothetical protein
VLSAPSAPSGPWSASPAAPQRQHRRRAEVGADDRRGGEGQLGDADHGAELDGGQRETLMANIGIDGLGELLLALWSCRAGDADSTGEFAGTITRQARRPLQPQDAAADDALSSMTS